MQIALDRADVLQLIDAGEVEKNGATITLRDSRHAAVAALAWDRARLELTDGTFTHKRTWQPAREMEMRTDNPFKV